MTKPKPRPAERGKAKHGGARPGAGRKPNSVKLAEEARKQAEASGPISYLEAGEATGVSDITDEARKLAKGALRALSEIAASPRYKASERHRAAVDILTWAYGKPMGIMAPAKPAAEKRAEPAGKKEALEQAAQNPNTESRMGKLLAMRLPPKAVEG